MNFSLFLLDNILIFLDGKPTFLGLKPTIRKNKFAHH